MEWFLCVVAEVSTKINYWCTHQHRGRLGGGAHVRTHEQGREKHCWISSSKMAGFFHSCLGKTTLIVFSSRKKTETKTFHLIIHWKSKHHRRENWIFILSLPHPHMTTKKIFFEHFSVCSDHMPFLFSIVNNPQTQPWAQSSWVWALEEIIVVLLLIPICNFSFSSVEVFP